MKKLFPISLMTIVACLAVNAGVFVVNTAAASTDQAIPSVLPTTIQDPMLMEAWIRLYNHQAPIQLWDGRTLTGRDLAQYLLSQAIPVVWDTDQVCGNGSCNLQYCTVDTCTHDDGKPGVEPIYIHLTKAADMQSLLGTLAHETFHRTQPFGAVWDTRFEEYWAFRIAANISGADWPNFGNYDPLDAGHLNLWIKENNLDPYFELQEYPATIVPLAQSAYVGGDPFDGIPAEAFATTPASADETK